MNSIQPICETNPMLGDSTPRPVKRRLKSDCHCFCIEGAPPDSNISATNVMLLRFRDSVLGATLILYDRLGSTEKVETEMAKSRLAAASLSARLVCSRTVF